MMHEWSSARRSGYGRRGLAALAVLLVCGALAGSAEAETKYAVKALPTGLINWNAINAAGDVAGGDGHAVIWHQDGTLTHFPDFNAGAAQGIADDGSAAGVLVDTNFNRQVVHWTPGGLMTPIGVAGSAECMKVRSMSDGGVVAGGTNTGPIGCGLAVRTLDGGQQTVPVGVFGTTPDKVTVNDLGHIAFDGPDSTSKLWNGTVAASLPLILARGRNLNDSDQTIGYRLADGVPVIHDPSGTDVELPSLLGGAGIITLNAINASTQVVGSSGGRAVIWEHGVPTALDDIVPAGTPPLVDAVDISSSGAILARDASYAYYAIAYTGGSISGSVRALSCRLGEGCRTDPLPGPTTVTAVSVPGGNRFSGTTDSRGNFRMVVPNGSYDIHAFDGPRSEFAYLPHTQRVEVNGPTGGVTITRCMHQTLPGDTACRPNYAVEAIEVSQGVSDPALPLLSPGVANTFTSNARLVASRPTLIRVFGVNLESPDSYRDIPVRLDVIRGGWSVWSAQSTIARLAGPQSRPSVTSRTSRESSATFVVPGYVLRDGSYDVSAKIIPPPASSECDFDCARDNETKLTGVAVAETLPVTVRIVPLQYHVGKRTVQLATRVRTPEVARRKVFPFGLRWIPTSQDGFHVIRQPGAPLDITRAVVKAGQRDGDYAKCVRKPACAEALSDTILGEMTIWVNHTDPQNREESRPAIRLHYVGLLPAGLRVTGGAILGATKARYSVGWTTSEDATTPIHELQHQFGFGHADTDCGGANPNDGVLDRNWSPGPGKIGAYGWDLGEALDQQPGTLRGTPDGTYDVMSYCNQNHEVWTSVINWSQWVGLLERGVPKRIPGLIGRLAEPTRHTAERTGRVLRLTALVGSGRGRSQIIPLGVERGSATVSDPAGDLQVVTRAANGRVIATVSVASEPVADGGGRSLDLTVPAPGVAAIDLKCADGTVLARWKRVALRTPKITAPRPGARLPKRGVVSVRWGTGSPRGADVTSAVDYSVDGGRSWTTVAGAVTDGRADIPASDLGRSSRATIRVRVTDGYSTSSAMVRRLTAAGTPPSVTLSTAIVSGETLPPGVAATVTAVAADDAGRAINGRSIRWFDGRRALSRGSVLSLAKLKPGRHVLSATAVDRYTRAGRSPVLRITIAK